MRFGEDVVGIVFLSPPQRRLPSRPRLGHVLVLGQKETVGHGLEVRPAAIQTTEDNNTRQDTPPKKRNDGIVIMIIVIIS